MSTSLPTDPPITPHVLEQHKISSDEYARIEKLLGRKPTFTELGVFSVMWSEHCSYKSSRVHLKRLPTKGPRVIQGPGENAGVVDIGDGFAAVFKMESHNHPSYIEPYQGAATGVGGILRDVFTMGARPIASLDSLRFGRPDHPRTPDLLRGVVAGIGGYGNCIGVPTVGGELFFDAAYDGNILVNAFTCGVARTDRIFYGRAAGLGNPILYIGARTGRDGIHGATMASDEFEEGKEAQRPTMQVGDPFMEKLLLEACLELFETDVLEGIQDMGAAGLTSSSTEMAARADNGIELDLDLVPRRAKGMLPYEILLSESQERMLLVARKGREQAVLDICKKWDIDAAVIGHVTDTKRWVVKATPGYDPLARDPIARNAVVVCDIPIGAVADEAPVYDRPRKKIDPRPAAKEIPRIASLEKEILEACASPNLGSRAWVWRQYDHVVRGGTLVRPGSDAGVVRVPCKTKDGKEIFKILAFSADCDARKCEIDPFVGGAMAVAECCRNLVCAGAEPIGLTDCLNFGNPERPEIMEQFARAIDGIAEACRILEAPIVSGNVSLYNETSGKAILPTPTIGGVGLVQEEAHVLTSAFQKDGDVVILLGAFPVLLPDQLGDALAGSEWLSRKLGKIAYGKISIDLDEERRLQRLVLGLAREQMLRSAHDIADGGLAMCLAECCAKLGADLHVGGPVETWAGTFFGEAPSRIVVSVDPAKEKAVVDAASRAKIEAHRLGTVTARPVLKISGTDLCEVSCEAMQKARESCLDALVGK